MHTTSGNSTCQVGRSKQYQYPIRDLAADNYVTPLDQDMQGGSVIVPDTRTPTRNDLLTATAQARGMCEDLPRCAREETFWVVTVHAWEVIRANENPPGTPVPPLTETQIRNLGRRCSTLQVRTQLTDNTKTQASRIFDVGHGSTFTWFGSQVGIECLLPPGGTEINLQNPGFAGVDADTVADTLLEVSAAPVTYSTGISQAEGVVTYTYTFNAVAAVPFCLPVPAGARRLTVAQATGAAIPLFWGLQLGTGLPTNIGLVNALFVSGTGVEVPGNACVVCGAAGAGIDTQITFIWELVV